MHVFRPNIDIQHTLHSDSAVSFGNTRAFIGRHSARNSIIVWQPRAFTFGVVHIISDSNARRFKNC